MRRTKLQELRKDYVGEIMTIKELDRISEIYLRVETPSNQNTESQWDQGYTYRNFLDERCMCICASDEYDYNNDSGDYAEGIWAKFDVVDRYDTTTVTTNENWEDWADVRIKIINFDVS